MFAQYHRSGEHDPEMDEWMSDKEKRQWARAAGWKTPGMNNIIRHQQAMIYSIAILDLCDFESMGQKMPKGTGIDASLNDGSIVPKHKVKKRKVAGKENEDPKLSGSSVLAEAIKSGSTREAKMTALQMLLEFGSEADKNKAWSELCAIAYGKTADSLSVEASSDEEDI
jgi:hypothetical protein